MDGLHGSAAELFRQGPFTAKTKKMKEKKRRRRRKKGEGERGRGRSGRRGEEMRERESNLVKKWRHVSRSYAMDHFALDLTVQN